MELKNIIKSTTAAVVCVIILVAFGVPLLSSSADHYRTISNEEDSYFDVDLIDENTEYTFTWSTSDPTNATVNGESVALTPATLVYVSDSYLVRYTTYSGADSYIMQAVSAAGDMPTNINTDTAPGSVTIAISDGQVTFTRTPDTGTAQSVVKTFTGGFAIVPSGTGDYVMKSPTQGAYVHGDSAIYASGVTAVGSATLTGITITGSIDDGFTVSSFNQPSFTFTNVTYTAVQSSTYLDTWALTSIEFDVSNGSTTVHATYSYFVVPTVITSELTTHPDDATSSLIGLVSILFAAALMLSVAGAIAIRRTD